MVLASETIDWAKADTDSCGCGSGDKTPRLTLDKSVLFVKDPGTGRPSPQTLVDQAGDTIGYRIVVRNDGKVKLTNLLVQDPLTGLQRTIAELDPGQSASFDAEYVVSQATLDAELAGDRRISNTATARADQTGDVTDTEMVPVAVRPALEIEKVVKGVRNPDGSQTDAVDEVGDVVLFGITVRNSGNVTLTNVVVKDPLTGLERTIASLAPGQSQEIATRLTIGRCTLEREFCDDGKITNTATADSDQTGEVSDSVDVHVKTTAGIEVTKTIVGTSDGNGRVNSAGDVVTYRITVRNTGDVSLDDVRVIDPLTGLRKVIPVLKPGQTQEFTTTYTVTQADIDREYCEDKRITNAVTATGETYCGSTVSEDANVNVYVRSKADLAIDKVVVATSDGNGKVDSVGDRIDYRITVTNTGHVTLKDVLVTDPLTGLSQTVSSLAPGQSRTFDTTRVVNETDLATAGGVITNTATARTEICGKTISDKDSAKVYISTATNPSIDIEKTVERTSDGNGRVDSVGDRIEYLITVRNTGPVALSDVLVTDPLTGLSQTIKLLAPGETQQILTSYVITQADLDREACGDQLLTNTAKATTTYGGKKITDTDTVEVFVAATGGLDIAKRVVSTTDGDGKVDSAGDRITYEITVTNTGKVTLTNILVTDPLTGLDRIITSLPPGQNWRETTTYTVTEADIARELQSDRRIDNTATAETTLCNETIRKSATAQVEVDSGTGPSADFKIEKLLVSTSDGNGKVDGAGDVANYVVKVTNTGGVTLQDIRVVDPLTGLDRTVTLAAGQSASFETTYRTTQQDIDTAACATDKVIKNTATATVGVGGQTLTRDATQAVAVTVDGRLDLEKTVVGVKNADGSVDSDGIVDAAGDVIDYKVLLKNLGNVSITDVQVFDVFENDPEARLTLSGGDTDGDGVLDVGESWVYTYAKTVTAVELDSARKVTTTYKEIGWFHCEIKECTGDLDIDNTAWVKAKAGAKGCIDLRDFAVAKVGVAADHPLGSAVTDGGSHAERLAKQFQDGIF